MNRTLCLLRYSAIKQRTTWQLKCRINHVPPYNYWEISEIDSVFQHDIYHTGSHMVDGPF